MAQACHPPFDVDCPSPEHKVFVRTILSRSDSVRDLVSDVAAFLEQQSEHRALSERAQIILAELLNNIVEHAYRTDGTGRITTCIALCDLGACVIIRDTGRPMPDGQLPAGRLPASNGPLSSLPEGGFGWFLVRELARDLSYERSLNTNITRLTLPFLDPDEANR